MSTIPHIYAFSLEEVRILKKSIKLKTLGNQSSSLRGGEYIFDPGLKNLTIDISPIICLDGEQTKQGLINNGRGFLSWL